MGEVIKGDYKYYALECNMERVLTLVNSEERIILDNTTIDSYEVRYTKYKRGIFDILIRIIVGCSLVGFIGLFLGFTANKDKVSYHLVEVNFRDGKRSMLKIVDNELEILVKDVF